MHAEVISIGDELTSGLSLDTNTQWLSRRLQELGISVLYHSTVGDQLGAMVDVFRTAVGRADVIVVTGGLGPTADDLTRQALAATLDSPLVCDEATLKHIEGMFRRRGWEMVESNRLQAMYPEGSRLVPNPHGTAPGLAAEVARGEGPPARVYCLPGVPAEMRQMWEQTLGPELARLGGDQVIRSYRIRCFGAGESAIEKKLPDLIRRGREPRVGITASKGTISLNIAAEGTTEAECLAAVESTVATIHERLGNLVYGTDDDELEDVVVAMLREQGKTLATVEIASAGVLAEHLRAAADSPGQVGGGLVAADPAAVGSVLDLPPDLVGDEGRAVELAEAMAVAVRERFGADYGLAVGPFVQAAPGDPSPQPVVYALACESGVANRRVHSASNPELRSVFCAKIALNLLRLKLLGAEE